MNADSQHETNVLLYYPITTIWAETAAIILRVGQTISE